MRVKYVQFYLQFFLCVCFRLFLFCRWVLIQFQSLEYVPFVYVLRKNQNTVLFRKIQVIQT